MALTVEERFWSKVKKSRGNGCWQWRGHINIWGQARFSVAHNKTVIASRFSWQLKHGKIPRKLLICHKCNHPWCTNPRHLYAGTQKQNMKDRDKAGNTCCGSRSNLASLTEATARKIYVAKGTLSKIGKKFKTSFANVWKIKKKYSWAHATKGLA